MKWFFLSLSCAFFTATTASISKLLLRRNNIYFVGWVRFAVSLPVLMILLYIYRPGLRFTPQFWKAVAMLLPLELGAFLVYLKALELSPLSSTFPFLGLTPAFSVLFSYVVLKEMPSRLGVTGVALVSIGAYLLNANTLKNGVLEPFKTVYREKGSMLMVLVAIIYSATSVLGKKAVLLSNPLSFAVVYYAIFFAILTPFVFLNGMGAARGKEADNARPANKGEIPLIIALGLTFTAALLLHFNSIVLTKVAYMISVKRISLVLSVFYGALIFKERDINYKLLGSSIMILGALVLSMAQ